MINLIEFTNRGKGKLNRRREKLRREREENERIENEKREQKEKEGMKKIEDYLLGNVIELARDVTDDEDEDGHRSENGNVKDGNGKGKQKEIKTEPTFPREVCRGFSTK